MPFIDASRRSWSWAVPSSLSISRRRLPDSPIAATKRRPDSKPAPGYLPALSSVRTISQRRAISPWPWEKRSSLFVASKGAPCCTRPPRTPISRIETAAVSSEPGTGGFNVSRWNSRRSSGRAMTKHCSRVRLECYGAVSPVRASGVAAKSFDERLLKPRGGDEDAAHAPGVILAPLRYAIEVRQRLGEGRHAAEALDVAFAGVIHGQDRLLVAEAVEQVPKGLRAGGRVLLRIDKIPGTHLPSRLRHDLHQTLRILVRQQFRAEVALRLDDGRYKLRRQVVPPCLAVDDRAERHLQAKERFLRDLLGEQLLLRLRGEKVPAHPVGGEDRERTRAKLASVTRRRLELAGNGGVAGQRIQRHPARTKGQRQPDHQGDASGPRGAVPDRP